MAKKNSTKTATKEALQSSEPRVQAFKGWTGINISEAPVAWEPMAIDAHYQGELKPQFLAVQNNLVTTTQLAIETRKDTVTIATPPSGRTFTGVCKLVQDYLFCAFDDASIKVHKLGDPAGSWTNIPVHNANNSTIEWSEFDFYGDTLICLAKVKKRGQADELAGGEIFQGPLQLGNLDDPLKSIREKGVHSSAYINDPTAKPVLKVQGNLHEVEAAKAVCRVCVTYCYVNEYGSTLPRHNGNDYSKQVIYVDANPVEWSAAKYLRITSAPGVKVPAGVTGIDIYVSLDENQDSIFAGHVSPDTNGGWSYNWLGALSDTSVWTNVQLTVPTENTTKGVNAQHLTHIDGRMYFWGGEDKYRLWVGGNPGNELSVARGLGGAFIDIEPGSGTEVKGVAKYKTAAGAAIVTIMCGNPNTGSVKRFNLVETNVTITNELQSKGYMSEEIANVIGCNSRWGFGVFEDGLYAVSRWGVGVTTMAMEYNSQLKVQYISEPISPIFTERISSRMHDARMVYINGVIYIVMSEEKQNLDDPTSLDRVVLCYDLASKAWYTEIIDEKQQIQHVFAVDSDDHWEGLGYITPNTIGMIRLTGADEPTKPDFGIYLETAELCGRMPPSQTNYVCQLELRFDYFVGDCEIDVEGIDYYGRHFNVHKVVSEAEAKRMYQVWIRVDKLVETYRLSIKGRARFRLAYILSKTYVQSNKVNLVYGFDDRIGYKDAHGNQHLDHHYLSDYNNLREAIVT